MQRFGSISSPEHEQVDGSIKAEAALGAPAAAGDPAEAGNEEALRLKELAAEVRNQDDLERDVNRQADELLTAQANERDQKRLERTQNEKQRLQDQVRRLHERSERLGGSATTLRLTAEISHLEARMRTLETDLAQIQERIDQRQAREEEPNTRVSGSFSSQKLSNETRRDFLIRTGKITPFHKVAESDVDHDKSSLHGVLLHAEAEDSHDEPEQAFELVEPVRSHRNLRQPGGFDEDSIGAEAFEHEPNTVSRNKRRRLNERPLGSTESTDGNKTPRNRSARASRPDEEDTVDLNISEGMTSSESDVICGETSQNDDSDTSVDSTSLKRGETLSKIHKQKSKVNMQGLDDGNEVFFKKRVQSWKKRRAQARAKAMGQVLHNDEGTSSNGPLEKAREFSDYPPDQETVEEESHKPHPTVPDTVLDGGLAIPGDIFPSLFDYQKTGVRWLWELYSQRVGGIVGDEMGLGKTIQVIAFLAGLHYSKKMTKPVLVVTPATVMKQWVNEFHTWWPPLRVSILHSSGSGMLDLQREAAEEEDLLSRKPTSGNGPTSKTKRSARKIVERVKQEGHVLVTTYTGLQSYADLLISTDWECAILDEGHKIRNPNIGITIYCKELRTTNRIILSGTPMQNNLVELWSLFDFIFPMRLGTLVNFRQQFEFPIRQGGYANATNLQVQTALKCAETLKDAISPYLLQRFKADVAADLPKKTEQVLFCKLTKVQRNAYEDFLASDDLRAIMAGKRQVLYGIDILRKICNHPDLQDHKRLSIKAGYNYGSGAKSGKMQVVKALLELWREQGHRTLLFAQHRIMLDILERFIRSLPDFNYRRMDGETPIHARQGMVDEFNNNLNAHVFLLTTKVGGLGVNLTGADRVIIFDPDWNPSTDIQARERAWRLGQKREVMIYRLMTSGTIEEKIYHRQLFKQFLINKILRDPKQRQTFQMKDLHDLFTLGSAEDGSTETGGLFKGAEVRFDIKEPEKTTSADSNTSEVQSDSRKPDANENEIRKLDGVASMERFSGGEGEEKKSSGSAANSEARVMESIFARSGVHAALEHDQIVNGRRILAADPQMIEQEAKRVAAQAARELKKAGEAARNIPVGTPTWTGQFGTAGRPQQHAGSMLRGRGGLASARLLAGIQSRQAAGGHVNNARTNAQGTGTPLYRAHNFIKMIRDYLNTHGGQVHTQMLIDHFNRYCTTPEKTAEFKAMLMEIAVLQKGSRGRGIWRLKEDYQT